jgi:hypothetical protein
MMIIDRHLEEPGSAAHAASTRIGRWIAGFVAAPVLLIATCSPLLAGDDGGSPGAFLRFGTSARSLALGNAVTGVADDVATAYWNPAGLAQLRTLELSAMGASLFEDTQYGFVSLGLPTNNFGTFSLGGTFVRSGGFERATLFEDFDEEFSEAEQMFSVGYARGSGRFAWGVALKSVSQSIGGASGSGFGADLGLYFRPARNASFGFAVQNAMAPQITLDQQSERLARTYRAGAGLRFFGSRFLVLTDVAKTEFQDLTVQSGLELWPRQGFGLRSGYDASTQQLAIGGGMRWGNWQFDYTHLAHDLGRTNIVSATLRFGVPYGVKVKRDRALFSPSGEDREVRFDIETAVRGQIDSWELEIEDREGNPIRTLSGNGPPPGEIVWSGDDDNGRLVTDGSYLVRMVIIDDLGEHWEFDTSVEVMGFRDRTRKPVRIEISGEPNPPAGGQDR